MRKAVFCGNSMTGMVNFRLDVIKSFRSGGWEVVVVVPGSSQEKRAYDSLKAVGKVYVVDVDFNGTNPTQDLKLFLKLRRIFKHERPDIVFNYTIKPNIYGALAAKSLNIPSVDMVAGLGYAFDGGGLKKKFIRSLYKLGLSSANKVLALNKDNAEVLLRGNYVRPNNLILLKGGEGVDLVKYPFRPARYAGTRFLMIARVLYDKGYKEFVEAAKIVKRKYPETVFELLGPIDKTSPMRVPEDIIAADEKSGAIKYLGATNDVPSFVGREDVVVVLPSKYFEGLNRSLMEACSMGRPVITTDIPGCRETVDDGVNGFLCDKGSAESLAKAIIKFIELPDDNKICMAAASRLKAEQQFDMLHVKEVYHDLVKRVL